VPAGFGGNKNTRRPNRCAGGGTMPLSEHEQRLLDQIERALYAEDPKFASTVRGARLRKPSRRRRLQGIALFVLGVALLLLGVMFPLIKLASVPVVSVLGFLVMFFGALITWTSLRRGDAAESEAEASGLSQGSPGDKKRHGGFSQRMEDRFRRRFDDDR
jgi:xanthosine utilization system XapX-like protein